MVTITTLDNSIREAKRFIREANLLKAEMKANGNSYIITGTRQSGATRRASLDLSRSLSDLRRR